MPLPVVGSTWNMPASIRVHTFHGAYCTATSRVVPDASQSATGWLRYRGAPEGWIFTRRRELRKKNRSLQLKSRSRCGLVSQWLCAQSFVQYEREPTHELCVHWRFCLERAFG